MQGKRGPWQGGPHSDRKRRLRSSRRLGRRLGGPSGSRPGGLHGGVQGGPHGRRLRGLRGARQGERGPGQRRQRGGRLGGRRSCRLGASMRQVRGLLFKHGSSGERQPQRGFAELRNTGNAGLRRAGQHSGQRAMQGINSSRPRGGRQLRCCGRHNARGQNTAIHHDRLCTNQQRVLMPQFAAQNGAQTAPSCERVACVRHSSPSCSAAAATPVGSRCW